MSDADIREFSRTRTGSPITKIELDTLNVALASNGGQVYIDDVIQPNSPINDGRRSHIDLQGEVLEEEIILNPAPITFFDDFLVPPNDIDTNEWFSLVTSGSASYTVADSYLKLLAPANLSGQGIWMQRKFSLNEGSNDYIVEGNFTVKELSTGGKFGLATNAGYSFPNFINPRETLLFVNGQFYYSHNDGVTNYNYSLGGSASVNDVFDIRLWHHGTAATIIIDKNSIEIINTEKTTNDTSATLYGYCYCATQNTQCNVWINSYAEGT